MLSKRKLFFIFISMFIFILFSSFSLAYTWDDFTEFVSSVDSSILTSNQQYAKTNFISDLAGIKAFINNNSNVDNYNAFGVSGNGSGQLNISLWVKTSSNSWTINGSSIGLNSGTNIHVRVNLGSTGSGRYYWNSNSAAFPTPSNGIYLLEDATTANLNYSGLVAQNYYNAITSNDVVITNSSTIPFNIQQGRVGLSYDINNISYKLYTETNVCVEDLTVVYTTITSGKSFNLLLDTFTRDNNWNI